MMNDAQEADCESPLKEEKWEKSMVLQSSIYLVILTMRSNQDARTKSISLFTKFYAVRKKRICCNPRLCRDHGATNLHNQGEMTIIIGFKLV